VLDASQFGAAHDEDSLSFEYVGALQFLTNILAMFGIFSCISVGPASSFTEYRYLLEQEGLIQMEKITGCKNWVLLAILQVGELDKWKREEQEHHRLSLKDLGTRATAIEGMIETGLRESSGGALTDLVTSIYATSTLTYMHSVVSGLNPNLREVKDSVAATAALLKQLPDVRVAKNLVWPLVVTGCMASRNQEEYFKGIIAVAGTSVRGLRNCWVLSTIWDRTWKMRDTITTTSHTVWEDLINGQGPSTLLV
jgi:C6 transcription factor Pro1